MDFTSLTAKITDLGSKAFNASVDALGKTTDFTFENLKKTPFMLKVPADFEAVRTEKKLVVFILGKDDPETKNILLQLPILFSKAWIESVTLRAVAAGDSPDLVKILGGSTPGVLFYREGELKFNLQGEQIAEFVKTFDIRRDWNAPAPNPDAPPAAADPFSSNP